MSDSAQDAHDDAAKIARLESALATACRERDEAVRKATGPLGLDAGQWADNACERAKERDAALAELATARKARDTAEAKARWIEGVKTASTITELVGKLPPDILMAPMPFPDRLDYTAKMIRATFDRWLASSRADLLATVEKMRTAGDAAFTCVYHHAKDCSTCATVKEAHLKNWQQLPALSTPAAPLADTLKGERWFPMQNGPAIPWKLAELLYAGYSALYGTEQSLERLAERHGFGWSEIEHFWQRPRFREAFTTALAALKEIIP